MKIMYRTIKPGITGHLKVFVAHSHLHPYPTHTPTSSSGITDIGCLARYSFPLALL